MPATLSTAAPVKSNYAEVNDIKMYYEVYGKGTPLVLLHGGGSTIQSTFGRMIPHLADHYQVIAVELQNHGRSGFRLVPETFAQDADDTAALLQHLGIGKASFIGFSNGGQTCIELSLRHPQLINKMVIAACPFKRSGFFPGFFEFMPLATLDNMPPLLKAAFLAVTPDNDKLQMMFERDRDRMINFQDWTDDQIRSIDAPTLLINGDKDVMTLDHAVEMYRLIPNCRLAIIPGEHGSYFGEVTTLQPGQSFNAFIVPLIKEFLYH